MVKLLFLPKCLKEDYFERIECVAKKKGYNVYIVPGGSRMKKIMEDYVLNPIEKIVGVACYDEIELAKKFFNELGLWEKVVPVPLITDGCINTEVNLEELIKSL